VREARSSQRSRAAGTEHRRAGGLDNHSYSGDQQQEKCCASAFTSGQAHWTKTAASTASNSMPLAETPGAATVPAPPTTRQRTTCPADSARPQGTPCRAGRGPVLAAPGRRPPSTAGTRRVQPHDTLAGGQHHATAICEPGVSPGLTRRSAGTGHFFKLRQHPSLPLTRGHAAHVPHTRAVHGRSSARDALYGTPEEAGDKDTATAQPGRESGAASQRSAGSPRRAAPSKTWSKTGDCVARPL